MRSPVMRVLLLLAISCVVITHCDMEDASVRSLDDYGDADLKESELETQAKEEEPGLNDFNINAEDQEDRIGSFGGFEDTEAKPVHHKPKAEEDTMQDELKAIEGKDIGESNDSENGGDVETVNDKKIKQEGNTDKATSDTQKNEAEIEAAKKAEAERKKKDEEEAALQAQRDQEVENEKERSKKKADVLERQLQKARDAAAREAKEEATRESKDKADDKKVLDARAAENKIKKEKEQKDQQVFRQQENKEKEALKKDADDARERELAAAKERTRKQDESGVKSSAKIKEHGEKAYDKELALEAAQKATALKKQQEVDAAHASKERAEKNKADQESSEKINEQTSKSNERDEKLEKVAKSSESAAEKANKAADHEGAAKTRTEAFHKALYRHSQAVDLDSTQEENAEKQVLKAFSESSKNKATTHEKLMKTRLSAALSKEKEAKLVYKKSREQRETVGKGAREMSKKAAEKAGEKLEGLVEAKTIAQNNLVEARRARASVNKEHAITAERSDKEFSNKADGREKGLKAKVEKAEKQAAKAKEHVDKFMTVAKKASAEEKAHLERESKFDKGHYEKFEKRVELSKQRVTQWIDEDEQNEKKLQKMKDWEIAKKHGVETAAMNEGKAKADESSTKAKIETNQKQMQESKEKVEMDERLKEGMQKADEETEKIKEKETKKAKADEQAAVDKSMAAEEKETKLQEQIEKALVIEKERAEKEDEAASKSKSKGENEEKMKANSEKLKLTMERSGKRNVVLKASLKASEIKSKDVQAAYTQEGKTEAEQKAAEDKFAAAKSDVLRAEADEKAWKEKMTQDEKAEATLKADEEKAKKEKDDLDKTTEETKKKEIAEKETEKNDQEKAGKEKVSEVADKRALVEQKEQAAENAIKQKRASEKAAKEMVAAKAKEAEEAIRLKKEKDVTDELKSKKMQADSDVLKTSEDMKISEADLKTAGDTLGKREEKHKEWKITLENRRDTEKKDRERELKTIPLKNKKASYQRYQDVALAKRKIAQSTQAHYEKLLEAHTTANNTVAEKSALNAGLQNEKKDYEKRLLVELMRDVKQQKVYREIEEKNLKDTETLSHKHSLRLAFVQQRAELIQKLKDEAAEAKEVKEKEESDTTLFKLEEKKVEEAPTKDKGDQSTQEMLDEAEANLREEKEKQDAKEAAAQEKLDKVKKVEQDNEDKKAKLQNDIDALAREVKDLKGSVAQKESDLKVNRKDDAKRLKELRSNEKATKMKEIKLKRGLLDASEKEEGIRSELAEAEELNTEAQSVKTRAWDKEKMAAEIVTKGKTTHEAYEAKRTAMQMEIQSQEEAYNGAKKLDDQAKHEEMQGKEEKEAADAARDASLSERNKANEKEKDSKNDALEKTKKQEASAIQRAIERKNKAGEAAEKAFLHKSELQDKQLAKAKARHTAIIQSLDNIMQEKNTLSKRYQVPDEAAVKEEEERATSTMNAAEITTKKATADMDKAIEWQTGIQEHVAEKTIKLDEGKSKLKTAQNVLEQAERSHEGAQKAQTLVKNDAEKSAAAKKTAETQAEEASARKGVTFKTDTLDTLQAQADKIGRAEVRAKKKVIDGREEKSAAIKDQTAAQRSQESFMKVAERYRTLSGQMMEREGKRKSSSAQVAEDEKHAKTAQDHYKQERAKCSKLKDANANVGKAYAILKKQMQEWTHKNPWLKQKEEEENKAEEAPSDPDPDVGSGIDDVEPIYGDDDTTSAPAWARRSFLQLLQEDYGTDVRGLLSSR